MSDNQEIVSLKSAEVSDVPQFQTAEYAGVAGTERCHFCGKAIAGEYFRANCKMACGQCGVLLRHGLAKQTDGAFTRALLLGSGAAVLGLILYAGFTILTKLYFGYVALGVGWLVAKAMMKGSKGIGGSKYQWTAVLLTYAAISLAAVPIGLAAVDRPAVNVVSWLMAGILSPFLELQNPVHGMIGLVILFVGLRIAWKLTAGRRLEVDGPFSTTAG